MDPVWQLTLALIPVFVGVPTALLIRRWSLPRAESTREAIAEFLKAENQIYRRIVQARREYRSNADTEEYRRVLSDISPIEGQAALDSLRNLKARDQKAAEKLWLHLRGTPVVCGTDLSSASWHAWKDTYWELRRGIQK